MAEMRTFGYYFSIADLDTDGHINPDEALAFFTNFGLQKEVVEEILRCTSYKGTGLLSRVEFIHALRLVTLAQKAGRLPLDKIKPFVARELETTRQGVKAAAIGAPQFFQGESSVPKEAMGAAGDDNRPKENVALTQAQMNLPAAPAPQKSGKNLSEKKTYHKATLATLSDNREALMESVQSDLPRDLKKESMEEKLNKLELDNRLMRFDFEQKVRELEDSLRRQKHEHTKLLQISNDNNALLERRLREQKKRNGLLQLRSDEKDFKYDCLLEEHDRKYDQLREERDLAVAVAEDLSQRINQDLNYDRVLRERDVAISEVEKLCRKRDQMLAVLVTAMHREFSQSALQDATDNYSELRILGKGAFGCVYRGHLRGLTVAVKRLLSHNILQEQSQFEQEVITLSMVRHPHLIALLGACGEAYTLVYEFMAAGSLEDFLKTRYKRRILTWKIRVRILAEICSALIFLHESEPHQIAHGDIKDANILLDANLSSKLSDFGLAHVLLQYSENNTNQYQTDHPAGTLGYMDPEYYLNGVLTSRCDVYSYGFVIMRLLTAMPVIDRETKVNIRTPVSEAMEHGTLMSIVDREAGGWPDKVVLKLADLALRCTIISGKDRPSMSGVCEVLKAVRDEKELPSHSYSRSVKAGNDVAGFNRRGNIGR